MKKLWIGLVIYGFLASCLAGSIDGKVVGVSDGDTLTLLDAINVLHKIRLSGIDAPEKAQPYGKKSKQSLSDLVMGKNVIVDTNKNDRYGREVGKVLVDGVDANLEQIKRGLAWHYRAYQGEQSTNDRLAYAAAEKEASAGRIGLWQEDTQVAPWEWRHQLRARQ